MPNCPSLTPSWDRAQWAKFADQLLMAVRPFTSPGKARIQLPGPRSGLGFDVDGLEGFTRTLLLAGFRLAGESGNDPLGLAEWYATGIATGTDPSSPERWLRPDEHPQAKVEAASLALVLDLTRPWIWDRLDSAVQQQVIEYLSPAVGDQNYHQNNWVWFRLVTQTFLRSVGGPFDLGEMQTDLATHDSFIRADGWLADGDTRAFDHYVGWALHLYPIMWARMQGTEDLAAARNQADRDRLDRFLQDAICLVGADGAPLMQGRSLIYRFATAAPYWVGAIAEVPSVPMGQLRRAASRITQYFAERGVPDERGLLTMGWHQQWERLAQSYSGPCSPYWASKGMLGLALPAEHPVWSEPEVALPAEVGDQLFTIQSPGWIISSQQADGVVKLINHGTDHAHLDSEVGDSPSYARLGYSSATMPHLDAPSWTTPLDNAIVLLDADGLATHRAGMQPLVTRLDNNGVAVAACLAKPHWLVADTDGFDHGHGLIGDATPAGEILMISLVKGPFEVRIAKLCATSQAATQLRIGGWPIANPTQQSQHSAVEITDGRLYSRLQILVGQGQLNIDERTQASPLGDLVATPTAYFPATADSWVAALVELSGQPSTAPVNLQLEATPTGVQFDVRWPDGSNTTTQFTHPSAATLA